jgi:hypothetical protein
VIEMDGGILLNGVVTNTTETTLNYQYLGIMIAGIGVLIALGALIFKVGKELGEMRGTKEVVESRLELIDEKYSTSEKIQEVDGKLNTLEARFDAEREATAAKFELQSKKLENTINNLGNELRDLRNHLMHRGRDFSDSRIGELQRIPAEESAKETLGHRYSLHVDTNNVFDTETLKRFYFVKISNKDEFGDKTVHEIAIEGESESINKKLTDLSEVLRRMNLIENQMDSEITQEIKRMQKEGKTLVRTPGAISRDDLPQQSLPDGLKVRRSRYEAQDIFFIIKGTEKEDAATEPPFKIEVERNGDFVSVSRENIMPLVEKLIAEAFSIFH